MNITDLPSPNFDSRGGAEIEMLVLHYTGMRTGPEALARLRDPEAKVSAHYVVEEDGAVYRLVAEKDRAWHAGVSCWRGNRFVNAVSVGIEIVNPGHEFGYRAFPDVQMGSVIALAQEILTRHAIAPRNVVGHSDVAPMRKEDPGELFDWAWLAREGVGLWPGGVVSAECRVLKEGESGEGVKAMQTGLHTYGYEIHPDGIFGEQTASCVRAFQRHFQPSRLSGEWDGECEAILKALLAQIS